MPLIAANGLELHVQELAPPNGPEACPLVLLHGLLVDNLASWYFTAAPRLARRRRLVMYDHRGHGKSERVPTGYGVASMAGDLGGVIDSLELDGEVDLVGHSWGALVALRYAIDHPDRVRRLGLVEAPLPPSRLDEVRQLVETSPAELLEKLPEGLRRGLVTGKRKAARMARALGFLLGESSLLADLKAEGDIPGDELARVRADTLCVYGRRSSCFGVGERLAGAIAGARLVELDGGHYLPLDQPEALAAALEAHLDG